MIWRLERDGSAVAGVVVHNFFDGAALAVDAIKAFFAIVSGLAFRNRVAVAELAFESILASTGSEAHAVHAREPPGAIGTGHALRLG